MKGVSAMRFLWSIALSSCALLLCGCVSAPFTTSTSNPTGSVPGVALHGVVHGGQSPIQNAHVYLYQVNEAGYGKQATSILNSGCCAGLDAYGEYVMTDMNGNWGISGDYTCNSSAPVYLLAIGGGPPNTGINNSAAVLAAPLGNCNAVTAASYVVVVNEVSTVAAAYAFAGFASSATQVSFPGTSSRAAAGFQNAFLNFLNLVTYNPETGFFAGTANTTTFGGNGTVPAAEIDTLANILSACVNSTGAVTGPPNPTPCYTLFTNALSAGTTGKQPTDTATAAINIAHNPAVEVANLFMLQSGLGSGAPFPSPELTSAPNDFTIAITYTEGGLNSPQSVAIDESGNVWVANGANDTISEFSASSFYAAASGSPFSGAVEPWGIAIDNSGNVWVSNASGGTGGQTLSEFNSSTGALISTFPDGSTAGTSQLDYPRGVAIDQYGNVWTANSEGGYLTEFSPPPGNAFSAFAGGGQLDFSDQIAVDLSNNIWIANGGNSSITQYSTADGWFSSPLSTGYTEGSTDYPFGIAIDASGNVWATNSNNSLTELTPTSAGTGAGLGTVTGANVSGSPSYLVGAKGVAIDGAGNIWAADSNSGGISEYSPSTSAWLSPAEGYGYGNSFEAEMGLPFGVAVDGSGDVWMTGYNYGTLTEFVGAATPVATPIVANLLTSDGYGVYAVNMP